MRIGVCLPNYGRLGSPAALHDFALLAEELGYDALWATDHIAVPSQHADPFGYTYEVFTTLAWLAAVTRRVRLATSVLVLPQREPLLVAKQAATLDQLSGGRFTLGVGVGWLEQEFDWLRAPFRQRGRLADEWIEVLRAAWQPGAVQFDGEWVRLRDAVCEPKPAQAAGIPIHVGGNSEAAIRRAARLGDGWHPTTLPPERLAAGAALLHVAADGRRSPVISMRLTTHPGGDLEAFRARHGVGRWALTGNPDAMLATLRAYAAAGVAELALYFTAQMDNDWPGLLAALRRFAADVLPAARELA